VSIMEKDIERETLEARIQGSTGAATLAHSMERVLSDLDDVPSTLAGGEPPSTADIAAYRNSAAKPIGVLRVRAEDEEARF